MRKTIRSGIYVCIFMSLMASSFLFSQSDKAAAIYEQNKPNVVYFFTMNENEEEISRGTGFVIAKNIMVTNYHLVSQAKAAEGLDFKNKKVKIEGIIAFNKDYDLALVKIKRKGPGVILSNFDNVELGSVVFAMGGNEIGEIVAFEGKITNIVEYSPGEKVADSSIGGSSTLSGCPIFDENGQVLGFLFSPEGRSRYILPANHISSMSKTGALTKFKKWNSDNYFSGLEGAYLAGRIFNAFDNSGSAARFLSNVVKLKPDELDAHNMLAVIFTKQRNYSSAVSTYEKIIELQSNSDSAYLGLGTVYVKMMKWKEAVAPLEKAIELNSDNSSAYSDLGRVYEQQKIFDKAAEAYKKFLDSNPENPGETNLHLAQCYLELKQFERAIGALQDALEENKDNLKVMFSINSTLAKTYQESGQLDEAAAAYTRLADIRPNEANIYFNTIIQMYDEAKLPDQAIAAAKQMIERVPESSDAVYNLGYMFQKLKKYADAIEEFKKAVVLRPDFEYAYMNLGYCYSMTNNHKNSVAVFKKLTEIAPDNIDGWFNLGVNYMQMKNYSAAVATLQKAIEMRVDHSFAYYNLAIAYLNLHDNFSARETHKKLVQIDANLAAKLQKFLR